MARRERIEQVGKELRRRLRQAKWWLYTTTQSPNALIQHHGITSAIGTNPGVVLGVCPMGSGGMPVLVFAFREAYDKKNNNNPRLWREDEILKLSGMAKAIFGPAKSCWNGARCNSFSYGLPKRASQSLQTAVDNYHAGCQKHPRRAVFCECGWFARGNNKMRIPVGFC